MNSLLRLLSSLAFALLFSVGCAPALAQGSSPETIGVRTNDRPRGATSSGGTRVRGSAPPIGARGPTSGRDAVERGRDGGRYPDGRGRYGDPYRSGRRGLGGPAPHFGRAARGYRRHGAGVFPYVWLESYLASEWPPTGPAAGVWSPLLRYRQVVRMEAPWSEGARSMRFEVLTYFRHRAGGARGTDVDIDMTVERIEILMDGRLVGEVSAIPSELANVRASVNAAGTVRFDRQLFLLGSPGEGFELLAAPYDDGYALEQYDPQDGYPVGRLNFGAHRVDLVEESRFLAPDVFEEIVPVEMLPREAHRLRGHGPDAYGAFGEYPGLLRDANDALVFGGERTHYRRVPPGGLRVTTRSDVDAWVEPAGLEPVGDGEENRYEPEGGVGVRMERASSIERFE